MTNKDITSAYLGQGLHVRVRKFKTDSAASEFNTLAVES